MKLLRILIPCVLLAGAFGCGSKSTVATGPDGETVTTDNRGNVTIDDGQGGRVDIKTNGENVTSKSSDGSELTVGKDGFSGTNEQGEKFSMGASSVSESELGLPFYPGSTPVPGRDMKSDSQGETSRVSVRSTADSAAEVVAFYKTRIESPTTTSTEHISIVGGKTKSGDEALVSVSKAPGRTDTEVTVAVTRRS